MRTVFRQMIKPKNIGGSSAFADHILGKYGEGSLSFVAPTLFFKQDMDEENATHAREVAYALLQVIHIHQENNYIFNHYRENLFEIAKLRLSFMRGQDRLVRELETLISKGEKGANLVSEESKVFLESIISQSEKTLKIASKEGAKKDFLADVQKRVHFREEYPWRRASKTFSRMFLALSQLSLRDVTKHDSKESWLNFSKAMSQTLRTYESQRREERETLSRESFANRLNETSKEEILKLGQEYFRHIKGEESLQQLSPEEEEFRKLSLLNESQEQAKSLTMSQWISALKEGEFQLVEKLFRHYLEEHNTENTSAKMTEFLSYLQTSYKQETAEFETKKTAVLAFLQENSEFSKKLFTHLQESEESRTLLETYFASKTTASQFTEFLSFLDETQWREIETSLVSGLREIHSNFSESESSETTITSPSLKLLNILENRVDAEERTLDFSRKKLALLQAISEDVSLQRELFSVFSGSKTSRTLLENWFSAEDILSLQNLETSKVVSSDFSSQFTEFLSFLDESQWGEIETSLVSGLREIHTSFSESEVTETTITSPSLRLLNILENRVATEEQTLDFNSKKLALLQAISEDVSLQKDLFSAFTSTETSRNLLETWFSAEDILSLQNFETNKVVSSDFTSNFTEFLSFLDETQWGQIESSLVTSLREIHTNFSESEVTETTISSPSLKLLNILENRVDAEEQTLNFSSKKLALLQAISEDVSLQKDLFSAFSSSKTSRTLLETWFSAEDILSLQNFENSKVVSSDFTANFTSNFTEFLSFLDESQWSQIEASLVTGLREIHSNFSESEVTETTITSPSLKLLSILENRESQELSLAEKKTRLRGFLSGEDHSLLTALRQYVSREMSHEMTSLTVDESDIQHSREAHSFAHMKHLSREKERHIQKDFLSYLEGEVSEEKLYRTSKNLLTRLITKDSTFASNIFHKFWEEQRETRIQSLQHLSFSQLSYKLPQITLGERQSAGILSQETDLSQAENFFYENAQLVTVKKQESDVSPMVKQAIEVNRRELMEEIVHVKNHVETNHFSRNSGEKEDISQLTKSLEKQEKILGALEEKQKGMLVQGDITKIIRSVEKNLQSSLRLEKMRRGGY